MLSLLYQVGVRPKYDGVHYPLYRARMARSSPSSDGWAKIFRCKYLVKSHSILFLCDHKIFSQTSSCHSQRETYILHLDFTYVERVHVLRTRSLHSASITWTSCKTIYSAWFIWTFKSYAKLTTKVPRALESIDRTISSNIFYISLCPNYSLSFHVLHFSSVSFNFLSVSTFRSEANAHIFRHMSRLHRPWSSPLQSSCESSFDV